MDAKTFLEATRRRIIRNIALALMVVVGCVAIGMAVLFLLTRSAGVFAALALALLSVAGYGAAFLLIGRRPLWQAMAPVVVALLLTTVGLGILLPEIALLAGSLLIILLAQCSLSNDRRLTSAVAVVSVLLGAIVVSLPAIDGLAISLGAALPLVLPLSIVALVIGAWIVFDSLIVSQNAALAIADQRAAEAEAARAEVEAARAEVERLERAEQQRLIELVQTLELPIMPIGDGMLAVPLVGDLDSRRAASIQRRLLESVAQQRAQAVIFDVTGIGVLDTAVAQQLLQTAQAVRLLGARTLLSGIRPEVARTLVALDIDFGNIQSVANLGEAIEAGRSSQLSSD